MTSERLKQLGDLPGQPPAEPLAAREPVEGPVVQRGVGAVRLGQHVRRGALEDGQLGRRRPRSPGTNWIALAPAPTTATRWPVRSRSWSHAGRVERGPGERVEPGQVGHHRPVQLAERGDQHVRVDLLAGRGPHRPGAGGLVVRRSGDLDAGAHPVEDAGLGGGALQVGEDLRLAGVAVAPVRVRRPRPGVERRRDVAGRAGVGVVAPDAADLVGLLEDGDVADAGAEQLGGDTEAAEAGADDDDAGTAGRTAAGSPGQAMVMPPSTGRVWPVT